jgi:hypothetical protein
MRHSATSVYDETRAEVCEAAAREHSHNIALVHVAALELSRPVHLWQSGG